MSRSDRDLQRFMVWINWCPWNYERPWNCCFKVSFLNRSYFFSTSLYIYYLYMYLQFLYGFYLCLQHTCMCFMLSCTSDLVENAYTCTCIQLSLKHEWALFWTYFNYLFNQKIPTTYVELFFFQKEWIGTPWLLYST